jgi:hypothetical protein
MTKRTLLTSVCLSSLVAVSMPLQAEQRHTPEGMSPHESSPSHCPPCPCMGGGGTGWVLIPYGSMLPGGTPCEPGHEAGGGGHPGGTHEPTWPMPHEPVRPKPAKPLHQIPDEDELEKRLKNVRAKLYLRNNPNNGQKEKEWGKEWQGKVYFRELGRWVSHPVLPETGGEPAQPRGSKPIGGIQEPKGTVVGGEQPGQVVDTQATISKAPRALHTKDGKSRWTKLLKEGGMDKWFVQDNGQWVLWDEQPSGGQGGAQQGRIEEPKKPEKEPVFFSSTNRSYTREPGKYNPVVPGARGTPQEKLSPVNRPAPEIPVGE